MFGYDNPSQADVNSAMSALKERGIAKVEYDFSGGNDEGHVDAARFLDAENKPVEGIPTSNAHLAQHWDSERRAYVEDGWKVTTWKPGEGSETRDATAEEISLAKINTTLEFPIYDRYGSFAGEFYVHGTLTWDVATGKHEMHGQESHEVWNDF